MTNRRSRLIFAATAVLAGTAAIAVAQWPKARPLRTVPFVDLNRYLGRWYEIARLPTSFEKNCTDVSAEYSRAADGTINVRNACLKEGRPKTAIGKATVADPETNAKLKVSFFWPFRGNYWVLALDPDYQWALVGEPTREYLWVLSRKPSLDQEVLQHLVTLASAEGFPVENLIYTEHRK